MRLSRHTRKADRRVSIEMAMAINQLFRPKVKLLRRGRVAEESRSVARVLERAVGFLQAKRTDEPSTRRKQLVQTY